MTKDLIKHLNTINMKINIVVVNGSATWGSHKGNCKNLIHKK